MSDENESKINEVVIVKRKTIMDAEEFVSIQLKSSDDTIESLLKKAIAATKTKSLEKNDKKLGIQ
ncbi:MAG: hypothetical protein CXT78_09730 [Thaumarchaeota archaeon]|jgi:hypothetical protein|nr:MAG: hypothetical protein CXT78_09730 [Nitrososphaerota archaeon]